MSNEKLQPYETKMQKSLDALEREYTTIRAGRANPHILDKLKVDYYGTPTPLQQVGNVTVPEARVLMIQPWESKLIKDIEKAILASDIGITPTNDGKSIRLVFPELTEERRKELAKDVKKKGDAAKTAYDLGLRKVKAYVKGPGAGRESAIRTIHGAGIEVTEIIDVTPMPHNGCRPKGRRKV